MTARGIHYDLEVTVTCPLCRDLMHALTSLCCDHIEAWGVVAEVLLEYGRRSHRHCHSVGAQRPLPNAKRPPKRHRRRNLFVVGPSSREIPCLQQRNDMVDRYRETMGIVIPTIGGISRRKLFPIIALTAAEIDLNFGWRRILEEVGEPGL